MIARASGSAPAVRASRSTASRSTPPATIAVSAPTAAAASPPSSAAGMSPRCRDGTASWSRRRITPRTGTPAAPAASRSSCSWCAEPTLLKITPPSGSRGSKVAKPCSRAAADELTPAASTTSTIGAPSSRATCAVDAKSPRPDAPSNRPITPSMIAMSAGAGVLRPVGEHRHDLVLADQPRVEVAAGAPGGQRVVAGVDVVRADLVRRDGQAALRAARRAGRWRPTSCRDRCRGRR